MEIYRILNIVNGKSYVGKTEINVRARYGVRWNKSITNPYLKKSIKKYGQEKFKIEILAVTDNSEELCALEKKFISEINSIYPNGYNFSYGGEGTRHIPDTKKRISETMKKIPLHHRGIFLKKLRSECKVCSKEIFSYYNRGKLKATCSKKCFSVNGSRNTTEQMRKKHEKTV